MSDTRRQTVVERFRAARDAGTSGLIVLHTNEGSERIDAAQLYDLAAARAVLLRDRGARPGTRVGVAGPNASDWYAWGLATWMLGATLVPLPVPIRVRDKNAVRDQLAALVDAFECTIVAAHERFAPLVAARAVVPWDATTGSGARLDDSAMVDADPHDIAAIMTTSGSTATPKGIARTYRAINAITLRTMWNPFDRPDIRFLTYSPCAHGGGFLAMYSPLEPWLETHLLSPERFARDPGSLFRLVAQENILTMSVTSSGVLAALRAIERNPEGVDLSSIIWMTLSFEMVDPDAIDRLREVGGKFGLERGVVCTYYGLSEGGNTRTEPGQEVTIDEVDLDDLVRLGIARPAEPGRPTKRVVSCGTPFEDNLRIAGDDGPLPERHVGEIQFRGRTLMHGYVGKTAEVPFDDEGWLRTGDHGYLANGELFVTGRTKEVIVQQGRKFHPEDIEWAAARAADVAPAACVAFADTGGDEGHVVLAIETSPEGDDADALEQRVRAAVMNAVGASVRTIIFVPPDSLPKATSGKSQRLKARERHARGELLPDG